MLTFEESKMTFSFEEDDVYCIEKVPLMAETGLKTTECVVMKDETLVFIEAKSSTPRMESHSDFQKFIGEITDKFAHSILFLNAVRLRHSEEFVPAKVLQADLPSIPYSFVLIVRGHQKSWLPPLANALKSSMKRTLRLWNIPDTGVKVYNDEMAKRAHLIVSSV